MKLPKWYMIGLIPVLFAETFFPKLADFVWLGGSYLVLGALILIVPDIYKKIAK